MIKNVIAILNVFIILLYVNFISVDWSVEIFILRNLVYVLSLFLVRTTTLTRCGEHRGVSINAEITVFAFERIIIEHYTRTNTN